MFIRKEGLPFIGISALISIILFVTPVSVLGLIPLIFVTWFFRDPYRTIPKGDGLILSPADGTILEVTGTTEEKVGSCTKVSIFMSVFNVHVNRSPVDGTIIAKHYQPGKFHMANLGKKTEANERMILYIKNDMGIFRLDQVAGLVARRIICWPEVGDQLQAGQKIGLIRFGSLLECYIPDSITVVARQKDRTSAGQTILGRS
ncbi:MAG: phosphatidylserine decarboxylase [Deltaproteobacteria bacterium]|nr:phosphatidylserine decarboxylase [Deltaproteobacteria bacterium]